MKVRPRVKDKFLRPWEARVITIDKDAIAEVLLENLMEHKCSYFDLTDTIGDDICIMNWDDQNGFLTYAVMPLKCSLDGYELNIEHIRTTLGITTNSLFKPYRYKSVALTEDAVIKKNNNST